MTKKADSSQTHNDGTSQSRSEGPSFDPAAGFSRLTDDILANMAQLSEEVARWEKRAIDRTVLATEQMAEFARQTLTYWGNMAAQMRETALDSARRTSDRFSSAG